MVPSQILMRRAIALVALVALVLSVAAVAWAAPTVKGDTTAWIEIVAAYRQLSALRTYRVKMTGSATGALEVVNPDRFHITMSVGGLTVETIQVGKEVRVREGKTWRCTAQTESPPISDPTWISGEVTVTRRGGTTIKGTSARVYRQEQQQNNTVIVRTLYVAVGTGLPIRLDLFGRSGKLERRLEYYDFDRPVTIKLPRCS